MANNTVERTNFVQWGCLIGLVAGIFLATLAGLWLFQQQGPPSEGPYPTPIVLTATITPSPTPLPVIPTATPAPSEPSSGRQVTVVGTGSAGLSMRSEPSTSAERVDVATEGEVFAIIEGPQDADGYVWWHISDPANPDRSGWAVDNYLQVQP